MKRAVHRLAFCLVVLVLAGVAMAACTGRSVRPGSAVRTSIEIDNQAFSDMTVYVVDFGQRIRLGRVTGRTKATFTIPAHVVGNGRELQFLADPFASDRSMITNRHWVNPGERIMMIIPP